MVKSSEDEVRSNCFLEDRIVDIVNEAAQDSALLLNKIHQHHTQYVDSTLKTSIDRWVLAQEKFQSLSPAALVTEWVTIQCQKKRTANLRPTICSLVPSLRNSEQGRCIIIVEESSLGGSILTPAEVLIGIHGIDPEKDGIPLKKVTDACNTCFQQQQIFTQQVLAKVLNQLVEQIPLPMLFMRTVIQTIGAFPALVDFIMEILSRLVSKQKNQKLWVGFLKCAQLTKPQSFGVLLQLPPAQLEIALNKQPVLKGPLVSYASQPDIRSSLPRSILVVLGIVPHDSQSASQAPTTQSKSQSQAQSLTQSHVQSQTQSQSQSQPPSQSQSQAQSQSQSQPQSQSQSQPQSKSQSQAQSPSQSQAQSQTHSQAQSQTGDTGTSEKEVTAEEPKESAEHVPNMEI